MTRLAEILFVLALVWILTGCATMSGIGQDISDSCDGYAIQSGQRAQSRRSAVSQAYTDGLNGIVYGK